MADIRTAIFDRKTEASAETGEYLGVSSGYAYPDVLVETSWVVEHLSDPAVRLIEADEDVILYEAGHLPGAVKLDWQVDVQDHINRDFIDQQGFAQLMGRWGITNDTTLVFYGDKNNWYACYSFWLFSMYGHTKMKVMNGGRKKWEAEKRPLTGEVPHYEASVYHAQAPDESIRAFRNDVIAGLKNPGRRLIDVRSQLEYTGELCHVVNYPQEEAQRSGHIPGARNIPWGSATNEDGTFKSAEELRQIYSGQDITPDNEVVTYCRIGERAAYSWFVLAKLLGYPRVRNYDGSWTEWGNIVGLPIEK
jgi:thiosulfate/3-mercaptopyruvate sulfurtransferase